MAKITREKFKTYGNVFDEFTLVTLEKLRAQEYFDELKSKVTLGKEANIFIAEKAGKPVIVKIYRLETCDFNKMYDYIKYDPRYHSLKRQKRQIIFSWVQREYRNLLKARQFIKVPTPYVFKNNVLVMEYIGKDEIAKQLKNDVPEDIDGFADTTIKYIKKMYENNLVHGDLSEFNILNLNDKPVFIDFSQASPKESPMAKELLIRDIRNVARFFAKYKKEIDPRTIYKEVTGKETDANFE